MTKKRKLLARARNNPRDVRFSELLTLIEAFGFVFVRQEGSHRQYKHPMTAAYLNVQPDANGKAKTQQVRQFLRAVDDYLLKSVEEDEAL